LTTHTAAYVALAFAVYAMVAEADQTVFPKGFTIKKGERFAMATAFAWDNVLSGMLLTQKNRKHRQASKSNANHTGSPVISWQSKHANAGDRQTVASVKESPDGQRA